MPESQAEMLSNAQATLTRSLPFEDLLEKLSAKDRNAADKHLQACEAGPDGERHAAVWRRLACTLTKLAPHAVKFGAAQSMLFYVPDGPYKMQVFALQDARDGIISIYCGDVLDDAMAAGLLKTDKKPDDSTPAKYRLREADASLEIEQLDGSDDLPTFSKHMVGWNRKALRISIPSTASDAQLDAVEQLCALTTLKLRHES